MAVITTSGNAEFPVSTVRKALQRTLPDFRWQCGEADTGADQESASFERAHLITGRRGTELVMVSAEYVNLPWNGSEDQKPADHKAHILLGRPTTDDADLARSAVMAICSAIMVKNGSRAQECQIAPGDKWFGHTEIGEIADAIQTGKRPAVVMAAAQPASKPASRITDTPAETAAPHSIEDRDPLAFVRAKAKRDAAAVPPTAFGKKRA